MLFFIATLYPKFLKLISFSVFPLIEYLLPKSVSLPLEVLFEYNYSGFTAYTTLTVS